MLDMMSQCDIRYTLMLITSILYVANKSFAKNRIVKSTKRCLRKMVGQANF